MRKEPNQDQSLQLALQSRSWSKCNWIYDGNLSGESGTYTVVLSDAIGWHGVAHPLLDCLPTCKQRIYKQLYFWRQI